MNALGSLSNLCTKFCKALGGKMTSSSKHSMYLLCGDADLTPVVMLHPNAESLSRIWPRTIAMPCVMLYTAQADQQHTC